MRINGLKFLDIWLTPRELPLWNEMEEECDFAIKLLRKRWETEQNPQTKDEFQRRLRTVERTKTVLRTFSKRLRVHSGKPTPAMRGKPR